MNNLFNALFINRLIVFALILPLSFSACNKKEGCRDVNATNYDSEAEEDGNCNYTKVIFYAKSNMVGGIGLKVTKIEIYKLIVSTNELVGTIENLNDQNPVPSACESSTGAVVYEFPAGDVTSTFNTRYYFENGTDDAGDTYEFSASKSDGCIYQNLTL